MCNVSIKVKSGIFKKEVLSYAMLDSYRQVYLMGERRFGYGAELQPSGRNTTLNLRALNPEKSESMIIEHTEVRGVGGNNN